MEFWANSSAIQLVFCIYKFTKICLRSRKFHKATFSIFHKKCTLILLLDVISVRLVGYCKVWDVWSICHYCSSCQMMVEYDSREVPKSECIWLILRYFWYFHCHVSLPEGKEELCVSWRFFAQKSSGLYHGNGKGWALKFLVGERSFLVEAVDAQVPQRKDGPHKQRYCRRSDMFAVDCLHIWMSFDNVWSIVSYRW